MQFPLILLFHSSLLATVAAQSSSNWPGWSNISNMFVFGDSYTTTGFLPNLTQPNTANPFGNPAFPGRTFSNGRNWIDFLTYTYNDSLIFSYNFARAGATVSSFGIPNERRPMDQQVRDFFVPNYAPNATDLKAQWASNNTLFTSFFGINDVNTSSRQGRANMTSLHDQIFAVYTDLVDELYQAGARNFLFMNVPAVNRSPFAVSQGDAVVESTADGIADFNTRLRAMAQRLTQQRNDTSVFLLDTFGLYDEVLDDPSGRQETEVYTNTTGFCLAYSARTFNEEAFNNTCGIPQKEFFWLDALHPTPPIHDAMAADIATLLRNNQFVGNSTTTRPNNGSPTQPTPSSGSENGSSDRLLPSFATIAIAVTVFLLAI